MSQECIFCKIASKQIPVQPVYEDEHVIAFPDINPAAPVHVLVIPKKHIASLAEVVPGDEKLMGALLTALPRIADTLGITDEGYRTVINTKDNGGQTVYHLHCHLLGGRFMTWPPG